MYDRVTSTEILTKALAMTISQVDQAAKNFSIKGFPLVTLIDKNPGHVTKILTAALNAATLQICKQKGLTPHLPSKTSPQPKPESASSSTEPTTPRTTTETAKGTGNTTTIPDGTGTTTMTATAIATRTTTVTSAPTTVQITNKPITSSLALPKSLANEQTTESIKPKNVPIQHIKQEHREVREPIFHKVTPNPNINVNTGNINENLSAVSSHQQTSSTATATFTESRGSSVSNEEGQSLQSLKTKNISSSSLKSSTLPVLDSKPSSGPVVYQFSKAGVKPTFKPTTKPIFKPAVKPISGASVKSLGPSHPAVLYPPGGKPMNMKLGSIPGIGIVKPQFYAKGKSPVFDSSKPSSTEDTNEYDEIKRSIAKFGKPTTKPVTVVVKSIEPIQNVDNNDENLQVIDSVNVTDDNKDEKIKITTKLQILLQSKTVIKTKMAVEKIKMLTIIRAPRVVKRIMMRTPMRSKISSIRMKLILI